MCELSLLKICLRYILFNLLYLFNFLDLELFKAGMDLINFKMLCMTAPKIFGLLSPQRHFHSLGMERFVFFNVHLDRLDWVVLHKVVTQGEELKGWVWEGQHLEGFPCLHSKKVWLEIKRVQSAVGNKRAADLNPCNVCQLVLR